MYKGVCNKSYWLHDKVPQVTKTCNDYVQRCMHKSCWLHGKRMKQNALITCLSQSMQLFKEKNKMWPVQLDEVRHKTNIKESSLNHSLTATVSLKHKCLSYSLITTSKRSNLWISSHAIKSEMYKQNQKDFLRLVVRFGYKKNIGFL